MRALIFVACFSTSLLAASNPFLGTWKLNNAKSTFAGVEMKEMKVVYTAVGNIVKRVATGIDGDGEPVTETATFAWDGKDHAVDARGTTVAVTPGKRVLDATIKLNGKPVDQIHAELSKNGNTMTLTEKGSDDRGRKLDSVEIFEKQKH